MDVWQELAARLGLKEETVKDLSTSGWSYRSRYGEPAVFESPIASLETVRIQRNVFEEHDNGS